MYINLKFDERDSEDTIAKNEGYILELQFTNYLDN